MTEVHCTGHVDYNPKQTTDFGYEMEVDNDGEIHLIERGNDGELVSVLYLSHSDIERLVQLIKEYL
jgi:hypothetical protein